MTEAAFNDRFIPDFLRYLKKALPDIQQIFLSAASQAVRDNVVKIKFWVSKSATGELSSDELRWLIAAQMDLTKLNVLKDTGLSLVKIDEFRQAVFHSIVKSIFKTNILP